MALPRPLHLLLTVLFLVVGTALSAQAGNAPDCFFQLQLRDSGGDGLNGGTVTVTVADRPRTYTLDAMQDDGSSRDFFIPVNTGDAVTVGYRAGAFPEEVSFDLLDNNDSLIYTVAAPATTTTLTSFTANCQACAPPPLSSIELFRLRYNSVSLRYRSVSPAAVPTYAIIYGEGDFDPATGGTTLTTRDTSVRINDLEAATDYTFYVRTRCGATDTVSALRGPFRVSTPLRRDIGVTVLRRPTADACATGGADSVTIGITNFGGEAQQFFEVDFEVNGEPGGVETPFDGIFTGVLGVDSTEFFTFDAAAFVGEAGFYTLTAFTKLEGEENPSNDEFTTTIVRRPVISVLPYLQDFEGSAGFWLPERAGTGPSSWERATPATARLGGAGSGQFAYVTNADGPYSNDELSYLTSPCFDFSGLSVDPFLTFLLAVDTEENFDGLYLEVSTDGGGTYRRVAQNPSSINWYNNRSQRRWDGNGGFGDGYALVGTQLSGLAGEGDVRMRFVFRSDGDGQRDGVAIDNIRLAPPQAVDFAAVSASFTSFDGCGDRPDTLQFTFTDLGQQRRDSVTVSYRVNGGETVSQRAAAPAVFGNRSRTTFVTDIEVTPPDSVVVEAWVSAEGDMAGYNDTTTLVFRPTLSVPFAVDFEDGRRPRGWSLADDLVIAQRPGSPSVALTDNLNAQDSVLTFTTASYGPFAADDVLAFTVRQQDEAGTPITDGIGSLTVTARTDCDSQDLVLLTATDAISTDYTIGLGELAGRTAALTVTITHGTGDFFASVDDILVRRCTGLTIGVTTIAPSGIFADDGQAYLTVNNGLAPFTYDWSTGDTTQSVDSLSVDDYSVTVTDAVGCTATRTVSVGLISVGTTQIGLLAGLEVFPNPTSGSVNLRAALPSAREVTVRVYDARGRQVLERSLGRLQQVTEEVELGGQPTGLYFVRVQAGQASRTVRVMLR